MYDLDLIKSRINCVDVAQRCGLPISKPGDRCVSPLRSGAKNRTSFVVDADFWYDFGGGTGGDAIDLLAELQHDGDRGAAIRELAQLTGVHPDNDDYAYSREWVDYTHELNSQTAFYQAKLTDADRDYLHGRGLTDDDIERLRIGRVSDGYLKGRLFLPYFKNGAVVYYATRVMPDSAYPDSKYMKQKLDDYCQHIPWGLQTLTRDGDTLVIAEGYFDAVSFESRGYPVLSAITGRFSKDQLPTVYAAARKFKRVLIVYDNDDISHAGEGFTRDMAEHLSDAHIPFVVGTVPRPYKDVSEYFAAGGDLDYIVDSAQSGILFIALTNKTLPDLEKYVRKLARHTSSAAMEELHSALRKTDRWDEKALAALFKSASQAPLETLIADEIRKEHQLIYINAVGFYEYSKGVWQRINDGVVKSYADKTYGMFSTNNRVNAVCGLLKTRTQRDVLFDRAPVWNFINGTLELDTGKFRDHNPNDFCSVQATYPYDPKANYTAWQKFIDDVTGDDPKAAEILQFIPAYALFHDCQHEKVFVLSGVGGNGKSRYLEILRRFFGDGNTSHLQPRALLDKFQVIQLRESIINIAGEIRSDLRDVEERIKSIASGEPVSGCYKGEQFVTFTPRTKLVFATNDQLESGDTSDGLARRLILVHFKMKFVDYPDPNDPYQREKDIHILDKLDVELNSGGIFNWVYEGYKLLKTVGYFTETYDQKSLLQDFKKESNPVLVFYEDDFVDRNLREITTIELYKDYAYWCEQNGYRAFSSQKFQREFKKVSAKDYEFAEQSVRNGDQVRKRRYYRQK